MKGDNPAFHVLEEKAEAMVRHFAQKDSQPIATSLMNNPTWIYTGRDIGKVYELISREFNTNDALKNDPMYEFKAHPVKAVTTVFLKKDSQYQLLDIDNDGKTFIVHFFLSV